MAAPATNVDFLDFVRKSGLIQPDRLDAFLERCQNSDDDPSKIALAMIQEGMLTNFQARQLLRGRYRGFAIGKYLLLEQLGEGGMGKVFLCEHMLMRRRVAIKVLSRELANDPGTIERFQREGRAVASLDHPNIVRAHDVDCEGDNHFIVMEYVDGASLHELVRKKGTLELNRAAHYIKQAAIGLQAVMDAGMIHRDIKPGNLLLDRKGVIKLLDLGLARFEQDKRDGITQKFDEGSVLGTADYLSPEQAMDSHEVDIRADIYSLGATLYFMLTGRPPFEGGSVTQKLLFHQLKEPEPLAKLRPDLPVELIAVVEKMMAKDVARRYQTPIEVAKALEPWANVPIPPPSEDEMPRLCLAALRAGTPDAGPLPNLPPSLTAMGAMSRSGMSTDTPRSLSATAVGQPRLSLPPQQPVPQFDPRLSGSRLDKSSSSIVLMNGMQSGVVSPSRVGIGESSAKMSRSAASSNSLRGRGGKSSRITRRRRGRWPLAAAIGLLALLGGVGGWWFFGGGGGKKSEQILIVSRTATGDNVCKSVMEAWSKRDASRPGRILIQEKTLEEHVRLSSKPGDAAWAIEGNAKASDPNTGTDTAAQTIAWKPLERTAEKPLLQIDSTPNLTLANLSFEGGDKSLDLLVITGSCPRLVTRSLSFRNIRRSGIAFVGAGGGPAPLQMRLGSLAFYPGPNAEAGVTFRNDNQHRDAVKNILMHGATFNRDGAKSRFLAGVAVQCPTSDIVFDNCTFDGCESGLHFRKEDQTFQPFGIALRGCEFKGNAYGLRFGALDMRDDNALRAERNRFHGVPKIAYVDDFPDAPASTAKWIWHAEKTPASDGAPEGKRWFRSRFKHAGAGKKALLDIICDDACVVYLNGKKIRELGPEWSAGSRVASIDVTRELREGDNVIAVEASNVGANTPAGLLAQITSGVTGEAPLIKTDGTWRSAAKEVPDWFRVEFDDDAWKKAAIVAEHGKGNPNWQNLSWDSEVRARYGGKVFTPVVAAEGNVRDQDSFEGFPNLAAKQHSTNEIDAALAGRAGSTASRGSTWILNTYLVAGPFAGGFDETLPPEQNPSPDQSYLGADGAGVNWEKVAIDRGQDGHVDFGARYKDAKCSAFAMVWIISPEEDKDAELNVGADDGVRVWHDGKEVFAKNVQRTVKDAKEKIPVKLKKGRNLFLFKVTNHQGAHGLAANIRTSQRVTLSTEAPKPATTK